MIDKRVSVRVCVCVCDRDVCAHVLNNIHRILYNFICSVNASLNEFDSYFNYFNLFLIFYYCPVLSAVKDIQHLIKYILYYTSSHISYIPSWTTMLRKYMQSYCKKQIHQVPYI